MNVDQTLDCRGLSCPMPIIKLAKAIKDLKPGQILEMTGTDASSKADVPAWCEKTGNEFLSIEEGIGENKFYIRKK